MGILERHSADTDGPSDFLNLKDGDKFKVVFLDGEPFGRERRWDNLDELSKFPQEIDDVNELLANGKARYDRLKATVSFNVYDVETKAVRIFEANATTARVIYSAFDMMDGPAKAVFEISRSGGGMDTTYRLEKVANLPEAKQEQMRKLYLSDGHDLEDIQAFKSEGPGVAVLNVVSTAKQEPAIPADQFDDFDLF